MTPDLRQLHRELATEVAALLDPQTVAQTHDDGTVTVHTVPPLIDLLRECIATGTSGRRRGYRTGHPLPISVAAFDLYRDMCARIRRNPQRTLAESIHALPGNVRHVTDHDRIRRITNDLRGYAHAISELLDPPRRMHVAAPCPACGRRMVHRHDDTGELVQTPALTVDTVTGCTCLACGHRWTPGQLELLNRVLVDSPQCTV